MNAPSGVKRTVDIAGALEALAALSPILGACAALVRALDGAPVLFRVRAALRAVAR